MAGARRCRRSFETTPRRLAAENGCVPVFLSDAEHEAFYGRICNETLWPALPPTSSTRMHFTREAWDAYRSVNERFAETGCGARRAIEGESLGSATSISRSCLKRSDRLRPDLAIGFFLHTPFPSSEVYRLLPTRVELLRGMLGADYVGFHTGDYSRHFRSSCLRVLGIEPGLDTIEHDDRTIGVGVHPIGIDVAAFRAALRDPETAPIEAELEERYGDSRLILGIERLDYTKGIPEKLDGFERLLEQDPSRADSVTPAAGARPLAARERRVPGQAGRDRDADRAHQRALLEAGARPGRLHAPGGVSPGARRPLPACRRDDGDAAPGGPMDEPRGGPGIRPSARQ